MLRGLLLIQFSPASSGAGVPLVSAVPARGQAAQSAKARTRAVEKAARRTMILPVLFAPPGRMNRRAKLALYD